MVPGYFLCCFVGPDDGVRFRQTFAHDPGKQRGQGRPCPVRRKRAVILRDHAKLRSNVCAADLVERNFVEQRPIAGQVALDFRVAARAEFGLRAIVEVATRDRSKGDGRPRPMLRLIRLRIPSKVDPRERLLGCLTGLIRIEGVDGTDRDPALLRADTVLHDPDTLAASSKTDAEAGQLRVENDVVAFSCRKDKPCEVLSTQSHEVSFWEAYGKQHSGPT